MSKRGVLCLMVLAAALSAAANAPDEQAIKRRIGMAEHYVREFEQEVARQRGGEKRVWHTKNDALQKVQDLKREFPDDPRVDELFERVRKALMRSKGDYTDIQADWTAYLHNEENLRTLISQIGEEAWNKILDEHKDRRLEKPYPAPDTELVALDDLKGSYIVLDDVEYPANQLYGATGEYIYCGKPSEGFYYVALGGRAWLGPYEAVKRYRRMVDTGLEDIKRWKVLGEIVSLTAENPNGGEDAVGNFQYGWVVRPVAIMVPGRVVAVYDPNAESSGRFLGEERVEQIKNGWYTIKEIPQDVTPERLMEIFMTAIKEKNYKLYLDCIDPQAMAGKYGEDEAARYHWDLHQERFHREYVHATFGKAKISVRKGFDDENALENFFLDDAQRQTLARIGGEKEEEAVVESRAFDKNGKQLGSPHEHRLIRRGGGRWYVLDYAPRF